MGERERKGDGVGAVSAPPARKSCPDLCPCPQDKGYSRWKELTALLVPGALQTMPTYLAELIF